MVCKLKLSQIHKTAWLDTTAQITKLGHSVERIYL